MKGLTEKEETVAKEIISAGLVKAAESLTFFMNETITLKDFEEDKLINQPPLELGKKEEQNILLLTTKVIGDLKGVCCLIFSEEEANHLRQAALPPEILESPEMMAEMSDGIMLEVDNIISASVITQFSNLLKVKIHGGVPDLKRVNYKEMESIIQEDIHNELYLISFKTSFESAKVAFNPEFVWLFDNAFIDSIKEYSKNN
jgi:chemotaxis protein CheY-P-specific phosphatase CheC